jgi:tetratricopeptide (TPR) repeat protein
MTQPRPRLAAFAGGVALLLGLTAAPALADTVVLRDGRVISGRVTEQGDMIYIEVRDLGGIAVSRSEVVRIESADRPAGPQVMKDKLLLKDGRIVVGDARLTPDGTEVIVGLGDRGEVRHPRSAVSVIQWRDGRAEAAGAGPADEHERRLNETIDRRVRELMHGTDGEKLEARRELLALGAFSRTYLDQVAAKHGDALSGVLADLGRLEALRKVMPSRAEEAIPRLGERLVSPDATERESAVRAVVMEVPDQVGPLLLHMVKEDKAPRVRAYCVSQLGALRRYEELAEVLKLPDGQLRLAAAFTLGDAGIYAGVPILIEALRLSDLEIRTVAIQKLTAYTGQHFGYRPQSSPEERDRAVAQWNRWWNENGTRIVTDSIRTTAPSSEGGVVTNEDALQARELWTEANRLITTTEGVEEGPVDPAAATTRLQRLERAADLLRQALDLDPSISSARMTRAVLLYEELNLPRDAERQLNLIISRAQHDAAASPDAAKKFANYHLGVIALREGSWERATVRFSQSLQYDPGFLDALIALGDTHLGLALAPVEAGGSDDVAARKESLAAARRTFLDALKSVERQEADLRAVTRDLMAEAPDSLQEGQVMQAVRKSLKELQRRRATIHFRIGRVCAALQDDAGTLEAYRMANSLDPKNEVYRGALRAWGHTPAPTEDSDAEAPSATPPPAQPPAQPVAPGKGGGR